MTEAKELYQFNDVLLVDGSSGNSELEKEMVTLMTRAFELFKRKQASYGSENIAEFGEKGVLIRVHDKIKRLVRLVWHSVKNPLDETINDTWMDIAVYALIAVLVREGKWPE